LTIGLNASQSFLRLFSIRARAFTVTNDVFKSGAALWKDIGINQKKQFTAEACTDDSAQLITTVESKCAEDVENQDIENKIYRIV
jgi:hypothetical protein